MNLVTTFFAWLFTHTLALIAIASAAGTFAGVVAKYTDGKISAGFSAIAGALVDGVKIWMSIVALFGGTPPTFGKKVRGVFDDDSTLPQTVLGKFDPDGTDRHSSLRAIGFALALATTFCFGGLFACSPANSAANQTTFSRIVADIDKGVDTIEQIAVDVGATIADVEDIISALSSAESPPLDAGMVGLALPTDFHRKLLAIHHVADGGAK